MIELIDQSISDLNHAIYWSLIVFRRMVIKRMIDIYPMLSCSFYRKVRQINFFFIVI